MSDNRTTELLCKLLEERGVSCQTHYLHVSWRVGSKLYDAVDNLDGTLTVSSLTPEQAIAATLGALPDRYPYEQRIKGDGSDWGEIMRGAYDDLMASACEACTPEQMRQLADYIRAELGSGTLTAEQVRKAIFDGSSYASYDGAQYYANGINMQAIADELNAWVGRTCKFVSSKGSDFPPVCSACGYELGIYDCEWFVDGTYGYSGNYCPNCGRRCIGTEAGE